MSTNSNENIQGKTNFSIHIFPWAENIVTKSVIEDFPESKIIEYKKLSDKIVYLMEPEKCDIILTDINLDNIINENIIRIRNHQNREFQEIGIVKSYNSETKKFTVEFEDRSVDYKNKPYHQLNNIEYLTIKQILDKIHPSSKRKWSELILCINISVQIKYWIVDNKIIDSYYIINYNSNINNINKCLHPFYGNKSIDISSYKGEIIKKNNLTTTMIDYLFLDEDKLCKYTGNTTPIDYKKNIMKALSLFWD